MSTCEAGLPCAADRLGYPRIAVALLLSRTPPADPAAGVACTAAPLLPRHALQDPGRHPGRLHEHGIDSGRVATAHRLAAGFATRRRDRPISGSLARPEELLYD